MTGKRGIILVAAGLVAGLVIGGIGVAGAASAPAPSTSATAAGGGLGLRLGGAMREAGARFADVVAKLTGKKVEDVQAQRQAGTSFAEIAKPAGVTADELVAETLKSRKAVLDQMVKDGRLTREQADAALARMETQLKARVDSTQAGCGGGGAGGGGRGRGGMGGGGCGGGGCGAGAPAAPGVQ